MINLQQINTADERYAFVEGLLTEAFPIDERRDAPQQRRLTDDEPTFHCCAILDDSTPVGLLNYWDMDNFRYVEHFAVDASLRCSGIGQKAFEAFIGLSPKPVVLEVELPDTTLSKRRVGFYQRQGLVLWGDREYLQPPYRTGGNHLPMRLMASPSLNRDNEYDQIVKQIHKRVYNA